VEFFGDETRSHSIWIVPEKQGLPLIASLPLVDASGSAWPYDQAANARLIAAAPFLLLMLQRMVDETNGGFVPCLLTLMHAQQALAKANGD
jgi:hypothetical protein